MWPNVNTLYKPIKALTSSQNCIIYVMQLSNFWNTYQHFLGKMVVWVVVVSLEISVCWKLTDKSVKFIHPGYCELG